MNNLPPREKQIVLGGGVVLLLLLVVFGLLVPLANMLTGMDRRVEQRQDEIDDARLLQAEINKINTQLAQLERKTNQNENVSLFSLVEKSSSQLGIRENLVSMRPQSPTRREGFRVEAVDLRLEKIRFDQLVLLLKVFNKADLLLNVRQLKIKKRFDDATLVDASLQVESVQREG